MNILILSRKKTIYSTRRLFEEAEKLGHKVSVIDPLRCVLYIGSDGPKVLFGGRELKGIDLVIPRVGQYATSYSLCVVRQFEMMGVPILNNHQAIASSKNKLGSLQLLARHRIPIPETLISRYPRNLKKLLELVGGTPVLLKLLKGTQGLGVMFSESASSVESILETIWSLGEDIMLQKFIKESEGTDLRVFVVGGEVIASMKRIAKEGDFRSNIHRGALAQTVQPSQECKRMALRATKILGLQVAGVDMLQTGKGPLLLEVNSSPGFQGLEEATSVNVAKKIIQYGVRFAKGLSR